MIRQCCQDPSDLQFSVFRSLWDPYLEAAFARFVPHWRYVDAVFEAAHQDYRVAFRTPFIEKLDYESYFLAVAYAHLAKIYGDAPLQALLRHIGIQQATHYLYVLAFCAIFQLPPTCLHPLLSQALSFRRRSIRFIFTRLRDCEERMKDALDLLLR